jgi:hypothetical protein
VLGCGCSASAALSVERCTSRPFASVLGAGWLCVGNVVVRPVY